MSCCLLHWSCVVDCTTDDDAWLKFEMGFVWCCWWWRWWWLCEGSCGPRAYCGELCECGDGIELDVFDDCVDAGDKVTERDGELKDVEISLLWCFFICYKKYLKIIIKKKIFFMFCWIFFSTWFGLMGIVNMIKVGQYSS